MNALRHRVGMFCLMALAAIGHAAGSWALPNTPECMLAFHGGAALVDLSLAILCPVFLAGSLCRHMQVLLSASILANIVGWILYLAYASPVYYDTFMVALSALQVLRVFYVARADGEDELPLSYQMAP